MLYVNKLSLKFRKKVIFDNISFEIPSTGITIINGDSGSGKTSFINCLVNKIVYDGDIIIDDIIYRDNEAISNKIITACLVDEMLDEQLKVIDFLKSVLDIEEMNNAMLLLDRYGMNSFQYIKIGKLSKGQKARISIIISLAKDCKYYFFDEPSSALDSECIQLLIDDFKKLSQTKAVIVSTHDINIKKIGDKVIDFNYKEQYQNNIAFCQEKRYCENILSNKTIPTNKITNKKKLLLLFLPFMLFFFFTAISSMFIETIETYYDDISRDEIVINVKDVDKKQLIDLINNNDDIYYIDYYYSPNYESNNKINIEIEGSINLKMPDDYISLYNQSRIIKNFVPRNNLYLENGCSISQGFFECIKDWYYKLGYKTIEFTDISIDGYQVLDVYEEKKIEFTLPSFESVDYDYDICSKLLPIVSGRYPKDKEVIIPYSYMGTKKEFAIKETISGYYDDRNSQSKKIFSALSMDNFNQNSEKLFVSCKNKDRVIKYFENYNIETMTEEKMRNEYYFGFDTYYVLIGVTIFLGTLSIVAFDEYFSALKNARIYYNNGYPVRNIKGPAYSLIKQVSVLYYIGLVPCFLWLVHFMFIFNFEVLKALLNFIYLQIIVLILFKIICIFVKKKRL